MISMTTPEVFSLINKTELGIYGVFILLVLLIAAELNDATETPNQTTKMFSGITNASIIPLMIVFVMIVMTRVVMIL